MADRENGLMVMDIYASFRSRPGDALLANNFVSVAARRRIPMSRIQDGLDFALQAHWVEKSPNGLRLTESGNSALAENQTA